MRKKTLKRLLTLVVMLVILSGLSILDFSITSASAQQATDRSNSVNYSTDVIYQIVTDRFYDGDESNNPSGELYSEDCKNLRKYCGGDWQGIIDKIDDGYLTNMGVTALWISPPVENIFETIDDEFGTTSYHGYWARDYKKTNPFFGSTEDFERLIETAHSHDIKIVIDLAPNHTSPADFDNPDYAENGVLYDDGNYVGSYSDDSDLFLYNGGTDFSNYEDEIYRNLFDLASFNHINPELNNYLEDAVKKWLDLGIDGIRVDAVAHMPPGWQKAYMDTIYDHRAVFTFGEWFTGPNGNEDYTRFANNSGMSVLDFRFAQTTRNVIGNNNGTMYDIEAMLTDTENDYDRPQDQVTFLDNHDMSRFTNNGESTRTTDIGLALMLTSRGVPTIYYGTEQYMEGDGDPGSRAMMASFDENTDAYKLIQKLAPLRKSNPAYGYGTTTERWINDDVLIYERNFGENYALIAINRNLNTSYNIQGLQTEMPSNSYDDVLDGLLDGQSIFVDNKGGVSGFQMSPGEVSVWEFEATNVDKPSIGQVGPIIGEAGRTVTISGEGFGSSQGTVHFGSTSAEILSWNDTVITLTVPNNEAGYHDITVVTEDEQVSNAYEFEVLTADQVTVRFIIDNAETKLGENVFLVGNVHELGNWDPEQSVGKFFNQIVYQYPTWYYDVNVPANTDLEFKFIKIDQDNNVTWQSGANQTYSSPESGTGIIRVDW
uniref:Cyclodextrin glucanotransferase n=1 Tax=Bacillus sp. BL-31 TaxID=424715 RepID=A3F9M7_9BACI|nr:cyclodextrin glucanotransferase [Bacillus sp. BL-31]